MSHQIDGGERDALRTADEGLHGGPRGFRRHLLRDLLAFRESLEIGVELG
jgi:hypothetical protein